MATPQRQSVAMPPFTISLIPLPSDFAVVIASPMQSGCTRSYIKSRGLLRPSSLVNCASRCERPKTPRTYPIWILDQTLPLLLKLLITRYPPGGVHATPECHTKRPNQSVELTATRRTLTSSVTKSLPVRAMLALGGGSSL